MADAFPWLALAVGVAGVGAAAWSETRQGSSAVIPLGTRAPSAPRPWRVGARVEVRVSRGWMGNRRFARAGWVAGQIRSSYGIPPTYYTVELDDGGLLPTVYPDVIRELRSDAKVYAFSRGSAAVDPAKRYRDLQRVAAPGSGATANERAMAERLLATMAPPVPQRSARRAASRGPSGESERDFGRWASKYQPWQTDPRDSTEIFESTLKDLNFAKKSIYEHAKAPRIRVSLQGFDGAYGRSGFEAFSSFDDLGYAAKALEAWGEPHFKHEGVYEAVIGMVEGEAEVRVLRIRGQDVSGLGLAVEHASFNRNPFNDSGFAARLRSVIEAHTRS